MREGAPGLAAMLAWLTSLLFSTEPSWGMRVGFAFLAAFAAWAAVFALIVVCETLVRFFTRNP